ncbi:hypothetical protein Rs2_06668 [Raphanus sativus]|nr:hypothetical protein Rs2_06668 [Raphanus sativus]
MELIDGVWVNERSVMKMLLQCIVSFAMQWRRKKGMGMEKHRLRSIHGNRIRNQDGETEMFDSFGIWQGLTWLLPEKFTASDIGPKAVTAFLGIFTTINEHIIQNVPTTRVILDHPGLIHPFLIPYSSPGGFYEQQWYTKLLEIFGPGVVDVVTHHIYILGSASEEDTWEPLWTWLVNTDMEKKASGAMTEAVKILIFAPTISKSKSREFKIVL